ncbi:hypothetical protein TNCV_1778101 [Trichonephila clavipes]|nr:hypothetical protein TNCV_1778101 [Trichonephila clavipes]
MRSPSRHGCWMSLGNGTRSVAPSHIKIVDVSFFSSALAPPLNRLIYPQILTRWYVVWMGKEEKEKWDDKRVENEGSLGYPGFVTPVFTKDNKTPWEKEKITRAPRDCDTRTHLKEGRPPIRWLEDAKKDLKLMGINRGKIIVTDKINWRRISESALACKKLLSL